MPRADGGLSEPLGGGEKKSGMTFRTIGMLCAFGTIFIVGYQSWSFENALDSVGSFLWALVGL
jgi:hypothetical protein